MASASSPRTRARRIRRRWPKHKRGTSAWQLEWLHLTAMAELTGTSLRHALLE